MKINNVLFIIFICLMTLSCKAKDLSKEYIVFVGKPIEIKVSEKSCFDVIEVSDEHMCLGYVTELKYDIYDVLLGDITEDDGVSFYNVSRSPGIPSFVINSATYFVLEKNKSGWVNLLDKKSAMVKDQKLGYSSWICGENILVDELKNKGIELNYRSNDSQHCPIGVTIDETKKYYEELLK